MIGGQKNVEQNVGMPKFNVKEKQAVKKVMRQKS